MTSLYKKINTSKHLSTEMIKNWETVIPHLAKPENLAGYREITVQMADMYKHDMFGLFVHGLLINEEYVYPHIRVNGYHSSHNYDSKRLRIIVIKPDVVARYYNVFMNR